MAGVSYLVLVVFTCVFIVAGHTRVTGPPGPANAVGGGYVLAFAIFGILFDVVPLTLPPLFVTSCRSSGP